VLAFDVSKAEEIFWQISGDASAAEGPNEGEDPRTDRGKHRGPKQGIAVGFVRGMRQKMMHQMPVTNRRK
jgi:hypothetical protein